MKRYDAIKIIVDSVSDECLIACNGMISRELFAIKDRDTNFYMLGSMGLAAAIGLGACLVKPKTKMIILAGDGNALMSLGTLATIGKSSPRNLMYIVLDNECHESTGGQETSSSIAKLATIASSCCFANSQHTHSPNELRRIVVKFLRMEGPSFIHIKVNKERVEVPRIMMAPTEIKDRFINRLCSTSSIV